MEQCRKQKIKPIVGCEMYVTFGNATAKDQELNKPAHQLVLARNLNGWKKLIKLVSRSNDKDVFYYKPRIDTDILTEICDSDLVSFSGHPGSTLAELLNQPEAAERYVLKMQEIFGKENFFVEIQVIDAKNYPLAATNAAKLRDLAIKTGAKCLATGDAHYSRPEDRNDHHILLCSSLQLTLPEVQTKIKSGKDVPLGGFFSSEQYFIPGVQDFVDAGNTEEEIKNTLLLADMCEDYDITGPPRLPHFRCPGDASENDYLRQLCRDGWKRKNRNWDNTYIDRIKMELAVIEQAKLPGYFLIVQDYVNWAKSNGWLVGPGRGSGAGCLVSYLLGITNVDPIKHDLLFERFYNAGRNTADRVSLPDIDVDFPIMKRKMVIDYIKEKYGKAHVAQLATFGRMQGRGAISEVFRIHKACDFETSKMITKNIPDEAAISDQLEESGEHSILRWTLINEPQDLADWCRLNDDDTLSGDYAQFFAQAIRLEGTYKSQGKHAAGIVISADKLDDVCPMINDKNNEEKIAGMNMIDMEKMGHTKFDILGVAVLDKLMGVNNLLRFGRIEE
jgi:DNA polymerase-3 subunit alpha